MDEYGKAELKKLVTLSSHSICEIGIPISNSWSFLSSLLHPIGRRTANKNNPNLKIAFFIFSNFNGLY